LPWGQRRHQSGRTKGEDDVKKLLKFAGLVTAILGFAAASYPVAQGPGARHVSADLNGYQEVNSISTTGKGAFTASIDDENQLITYELSYSGLEGTTTTQAHIHFAQRSVNGAIHAFLCGGGGKPPCPAIEGTVTGEIAAADVLPSVPDRGIEAGAFEEFVQAIRAGHTYANVHTNKWPGGEIRGQIQDRDQREFVR
jgi:CHRD domain-containing protein